MSYGLNKVILVGNVGENPTIRENNGRFVASFSFATTTFAGIKDGQRRDNTQWHRIAVFGKRTKTVAEHVEKGTRLLIEGELHTSKYTDNGGVDRWSTEVYVTRSGNLTFQGGKKDGHAIEDDGEE